MRIFLPSHLDSGNRGCEAITKGTIRILEDTGRCVATTQNKSLDITMDYQDVDFILANTRFDAPSVIYPEKRTLYCRVRARIVRKLYRFGFFRNLYYQYRYHKTFAMYKHGDICLSTGGDMFCYGDDLDTINLVDALYSKRIPVILWGCSIGEENLTPRKIEVLKKFSAITVRESLSERVLKDKVGLKNVYRYPDPAFVLKPEACELPNYFDKKVVGINLSNFVGANVDFDTMVGKNLLELFYTILNTTDMDIVLVPHVFWEGQDDRIVCSAFYERFKNTGRVFLLETEKMNYCQIRYAISKCGFFIGARTHAMISAYSMCVPAIALGYSIKSIGIAKDLGLPKELVADYRTLASVDTFSNAFTYLLSHETGIKNHMQAVMPEYIQKAYEMKKVVEMV